MSDLSQGQVASLVLNAGDTYRISTTGTATVKVIYGAPAGTTTITSSFATFGPYDAPAKLDVAAVSGLASYSLLAAIPVTKVDGKFSDPALQAVVSAAGKQMAFQVSAVVTMAVFAQLADGRYVCTDQTNGAFATKLFLYQGDPANPQASDVVTVLAATDCVSGANLLDSAGASIGGANAGIFNAWVHPGTQDIWFIARAHATTKNYFFRCKNGTWTVGSDAGYSNKRASIDVGAWTAVGNAGSGGAAQQTDGIRHLSARSLLFAKVGGVWHTYATEYNVVGSRTAGAGGGATGDQAIAYRSTDGTGQAFSVFLEFNTAGSHVVDHIHGITQDPYTGWLYIMTGDVGGQCAVIAYNGTGALPAANSTLAQIAATAGWKVLLGNAAARYTDLSFTPSAVYSLPDSDSNNDASVNAYQAFTMPKTLEYASALGGSTTRQTNLPPLLNLQQPGWSAILGFRTHVSANNPEPYLQIWTSDYEGGPYTLTNKIRTYKPVTAIPKSWFVDQAGRVWLGGTYGGGTQFTSAVQSASSVCLTPVQRAGLALPLVYDGA